MTAAYLIMIELGQAEPPPPAPVPRHPIYYKTMQSLAALTAAVTVPAHGYVSFSRRPQANSFRAQAWAFAKQMLRGCAWAAAIAAGMLIYTSFTQKWKENGFPTIPISALVAIDQTMARPGGQSNIIPLTGGGSATNTTTMTSTPSRQTNLLDLEEFEG
jgi:hypothetical protein